MDIIYTNDRKYNGINKIWFYIQSFLSKIFEQTRLWVNAFTEPTRERNNEKIVRLRIIQEVEQVNHIPFGNIIVIAHSSHEPQHSYVQNQLMCKYQNGIEIYAMRGRSWANSRAHVASMSPVPTQ